MRGIQATVLATMDACLKDNKVDVEDLTVDKGHFKSFDEIFRRHLDPPLSGTLLGRRQSSLWLTSGRYANCLITLSENEGSTVGQDNTQNVNNDVGIVLEEVLEEAPKWKVLWELLQEIPEEQMKSGAGNVHDEDKSDESGIVLVTCKDERTCLQLQECILKGPCQDGRCIGPTVANELEPLFMSELNYKKGRW